MSATGEESEALRLVKNLRVGDQIKRIDELYAYIKGNPEREAEVQSVMTGVLGTTVGTFIRRAIEQRKSSDQPCKSLWSGFTH